MGEHVVHVHVCVTWRIFILVFAHCTKNICTMYNARYPIRHSTMHESVHNVHLIEHREARRMNGTQFGIVKCNAHSVMLRSKG